MSQYNNPYGPYQTGYPQTGAPYGQPVQNVPYGQPAQNVHAIQLEMTQCAYMQETMPFDYLPGVAAKIQPHVRRMVEALLQFVQNQGR